MIGSIQRKVIPKDKKQEGGGANDDDLVLAQMALRPPGSVCFSTMNGNGMDWKRETGLTCLEKRGFATWFFKDHAIYKRLAIYHRIYFFSSSGMRPPKWNNPPISSEVNPDVVLRFARIVGESAGSQNSQSHNTSQNGYSQIICEQPRPAAYRENLGRWQPIKSGFLAWARGWNHFHFGVFSNACFFPCHCLAVHSPLPRGH